MENGKVFSHIAPPPQDTGIPDNYDFIYIKKVDTKNGVLFLGGGGGGGHSLTRLSVPGEGGGEGDKILKCYTFDLFTLSINIH